MRNASVKKRERRAAGFTLLEIILSLVIISSALLVSIRSFSLAVRAKTSIVNYEKAMFLADKKIFDTTAQGVSGSRETGGFEPPFEMFSWRISSAAVSREEDTPVECSISWTERGLEKHITVSALIPVKAL